MPWMNIGNTSMSWEECGTLIAIVLQKEVLVWFEVDSN